MPPIKTAQDAVKVAEGFLKKYHAFWKLRNAVKEKEAWLVEFDVGVLGPEVVRIRLHPTTGDVIEYVSPETK